MMIPNKSLADVKAEFAKWHQERKKKTRSKRFALETETNIFIFHQIIHMIAMSSQDLNHQHDFP